MKQSFICPECKPNDDNNMETIKLSDESSIEVTQSAVVAGRKEFQAMWDGQPDVVRTMKIFGKDVPIPRQHELYGVPGVSYSFSGQTLPSRQDYPELVAKCFAWAEENYPQYTWNGALCNWYKDGQSYIGPHSDDERDLVDGAPILSFSFGGERTFRLKPKRNKKTPLGGLLVKTKLDLVTRNNSVIAMCGQCQSQFTHEVPKTAKYVAPRINITIRSFKTP
jgi:alkylated DNA repair dioxygenase AlkB